MQNIKTLRPGANTMLRAMPVTQNQHENHEKIVRIIDSIATRHSLLGSGKSRGRPFEGTIFDPMNLADVEIDNHHVRISHFPNEFLALPQV